MTIYQRDPAAPGANVGRRRAQPERHEAAVEQFNVSDAARVVAGLTRSLGKSRASVGAAAGSASRIRITVAWELCWYQWTVDIVDGRVEEVAKGEDVEQLDRSARHWNAAVDPGGELSFGAPAPPARRRRLRRR